MGRSHFDKRLVVMIFFVFLLLAFFISDGFCARLFLKRQQFHHLDPLQSALCCSSEMVPICWRHQILLKIQPRAV